MQMLPAISSPGSSLADARHTLSENIQVYIRIRPLVDREVAASNVASIRALDGQTIEVKTSDTSIECKYDAIFDSHCTQADIYDQVKECTTVFLDGFNSTLFAYGQTGSGKSYTMFGIENDSDKHKLISKQNNQAGVIPRAVKDIFAGIARFSSDDGSTERNTQATLFCSFVQIYNEHVYDLLRDERMENPLEIVEDRKNGMYVNGISEYAVHTVADCMHLLRCGEQFRAIRSTHMNQVSSRSHSVFQLLLEQRKANGTVLKSKLNLVDLAGSEKWNMDSQMLDHHVAEMTNINLSLHTLGRCIAALSSTKQGSTHIPYRDSKLTRLLQDSLGGNTKTKIIATLSPSMDCIDESISTLKFADRAKQVMISARINEQKVISPEYVAKLEKQIVQLRELVALLQSSNTTTEGLKEGSNENGFDNESESHENDDDSSITHRLVQSMQRNADLTQQLVDYRKQIDQLKTCAQPNAVLPVAETSAILAKQRLESIVRQLREAFDRFFKYEIEEEELRSICAHLFSGIPSEGIRRKIQPKGSDSETVSSSGGMRKPLVRIRTTNSSPSTPTASGKLKRPTEIMYRMRNRTLSDQVMHSDSDGSNSSSKNAEKVLEMSQRALAKQAKLQAWYIEKEKRELSKLQHEQELIEAQRQMMRSRDEKFLKHAAATKKKLLERHGPSSQV
uniref:Kinesin-like protein n=1 Tax=Albugo laibachii Nc14 TaxID=890382 RepID=F0WDA6_9STRA|nr:kinesinlike protein putative [Albugo laibachii Nc14]|eukprot:CCA19178.1 kinesinlike protein putative [Albugo laibachii Nc14]